MGTSKLIDPSAALLFEVPGSNSPLVVQELQIGGTSVVDLTFALVSPRVLEANVKSKTTLESNVCWCPFGSDIRKRTCRDGIRMSEPGHQGGMTSEATPTARPGRSTSRTPGTDEEARAAELRSANINPHTGLATDYLNHFNEAVMLLEMIPDMQWQPLSYAEHFAASNFKARDLAIAAYEAAEGGIRTEFDQITGTMTSILTAVGAAMREVTQNSSRARLAQQATGWVKPLVAAAGGIINGGSEADVDYIMNH